MVTGTKVYVIEHRDSGRQYVGCGHADTRLRQHLGGKSHNPHLRRAVRIHGTDAFVTRVVECGSPEAAGNAERWLIALKGGCSGPALYNMMEGGTEAGRASAGSREQMSASAHRAWSDPEVRRKRAAGVNAAYARPEVQEKRAKVYAAHGAKVKAAAFRRRCTVRAMAEEFFVRKVDKAARKTFMSGVSPETVRAWGDLSALGWRVGDIATASALNWFDLRNEWLKACRKDSTLPPFPANGNVPYGYRAKGEDHTLPAAPKSVLRELSAARDRKVSATLALTGVNLSSVGNPLPLSSYMR